MNKFSRVFFGLLLLGTLAVVARGFLKPPQPPLRVAFQVCNSLEENRQRFEPLGVWLEKKLVRFRKEGKMAFYTLDDAHIDGLMKEALRHVREGADQVRERMERIRENAG